jgi:ABC-type Zn uptake system ZnuABC Zn-binding protein ZnuA/ABC-type Mn2+/Zn2+ transport system permease subunit
LSTDTVLAVLAPFSLPYVQRGALEIALLATGAGLLGTWIVLRGLAFYAHAVGTAAFPGLVVADGLAISATVGAFATAGLVAGLVAVVARRQRENYATATALILVAALAAGVILASDVFSSPSSVDQLLFGSLLLTDASDQRLALVASTTVLAASVLLGPRWLATGFDADAARAQGLRSGAGDALLLALVALSVVATLNVLGALLATALLVVPAATTRLLCRRVPTWQLATIALVLLEGLAGLWASVPLNAPPGATIATLAGAVFALVAVGRPLLHARRPAVALAALAAVIFLAGGCGGGAGPSGSRGRVTVVATTTQLGDLVRAVGGDGVDVHQILQPNTDPHEYEPRPADVEAVAGAKLVLENGDRLDAWMSTVISNAGGAAKVVDLGTKVPVRLPGQSEGPEASRNDPHWWHDPRNAEAAVGAIRDALVAANPAVASTYRANASAYLRQLRALDTGIRTCLQRVPAAQRKLVSDHDAFGYFAQRYGIAIVGAVIPSQTTQAQASAADIAKLVGLIRREHVRAVFPESSLSAKLAQQIARETGARADYTLYGDTLGPSGSPGATYLSMEQANADAMARGFTGGALRCRIAGVT